MLHSADTAIFAKVFLHELREIVGGLTKYHTNPVTFPNFERLKALAAVSKFCGYTAGEQYCRALAILSWQLESEEEGPCTAEQKDAVCRIIGTSLNIIGQHTAKMVHGDRGSYELLAAGYQNIVRHPAFLGNDDFKTISPVPSLEVDQTWKPAAGASLDVFRKTLAVKSAQLYATLDQIDSASASSTLKTVRAILVSLEAKNVFRSLRFTIASSISIIDGALTGDIEDQVAADMLWRVENDFSRISAELGSEERYVIQVSNSTEAALHRAIATLPLKGERAQSLAERYTDREVIDRPAPQKRTAANFSAGCARLEQEWTSGERLESLQRILPIARELSEKSESLGLASFTLLARLVFQSCERHAEGGFSRTFWLSGAMAIMLMKTVCDVPRLNSEISDTIDSIETLMVDGADTSASLVVPSGGVAGIVRGNAWKSLTPKLASDLKMAQVKIEEVLAMRTSATDLSGAGRVAEIVGSQINGLLTPIAGVMRAIMMPSAGLAFSRVSNAVQDEATWASNDALEAELRNLAKLSLHIDTMAKGALVDMEDEIDLSSTSADELHQVDRAANARTLRIFIDEARQLIAEMSMALATDDDGHPAAKVVVARRVLHTLKGSALVAGMNAFASIADGFQDVATLALYYDRAEPVVLTFLAQSAQLLAGLVEDAHQSTDGGVILTERTLLGDVRDQAERMRMIVQGDVPDGLGSLLDEDKSFQQDGASPEKEAETEAPLEAATTVAPAMERNTTFMGWDAPASPFHHLEDVVVHGFFGKPPEPVAGRSSTDQAAPPTPAALMTEGIGQDPDVPNHDAQAPLVEASAESDLPAALGARDSPGSQPEPQWAAEPEVAAAPSADDLATHTVVQDATGMPEPRAEANVESYYAIALPGDVASQPEVEVASPEAMAPELVDSVVPDHASTVEEHLVGSGDEVPGEQAGRMLSFVDDVADSDTTVEDPDLVPEPYNGPQQSGNRISALLDAVLTDIGDRPESAFISTMRDEMNVILPNIVEAMTTCQQGLGVATTLRALKRDIHTLKGAARSAGLLRAGALFHVLEDDMDSWITWRDGVAHIDAYEKGVDLFAQLVEDAFVRSQSSVQAAEEPEALSVIEASNFSTSTLMAPLIPHVVFEAAANPPAAADLGVKPVMGLAPPAMSAPTRSSQSGNSVRVSVAALDAIAKATSEAGILQNRSRDNIDSAWRAMRSMQADFDRLSVLMKQLEIESEIRMQAGHAAASAAGDRFDTLELDRFSRLQEIARALSENIHDIRSSEIGISAALMQASETEMMRSTVAEQLEFESHRIMVMPLSSQKPRIQRVLRQAATDLGKQIELHFHSQAEAPAPLLDKLMPVIEHILRNAVAHGVESDAERLELGKTAKGNITVSGISQDGNFMLSVTDDGPGIDLDRVLEKARAENLAGDQPYAREEILGFLFHSGFSTASSVSQAAGRGIGLDAVKNMLGQMGGTISIRTAPGAGTTFDVVVPSDISTMSVVPVIANGYRCLIPTTLVSRIMTVPAEEPMNGVLDVGGIQCELVSLENLLGDVVQPAVRKARGYLQVIVCGLDTTSPVAIQVDCIDAYRKVLVRPLAGIVSKLPGILAGAIAADGTPALIVNPMTLVRQGGTAAAVRSEPIARDLIMIVDDSSTVRSVTSRFLQANGYDTLTARDGVDAIELLASGHMPSVFLLDIEMPRLDGFELTKAIRRMPEHGNTPVVMVTSRTSSKHRDHADAVGANDYLGKPYDECALLACVRRLIAVRCKPEATDLQPVCLSPR